MTLSAVLQHLNTVSDFSLQASWDNSGLIVGDPQQPIRQIVLSIDVDLPLIETLEADTLLITHHPLIFGSLKSLDFSRYPALLLRRMIEKRIANVAMHTNFDQTHLNAWVATHVLGVAIEAQEDYVIYFRVDQDFDTFAGTVRQRFGLGALRTVPGRAHVGRAALITGAGASMLREIDADCLLTGDVKYHDAMEAGALGISVIDVGHYESERYFPDALLPELQNLDIAVTVQTSQNPFMTT